MRYSEKWNRLDAHCRRHPGGCKMDRQLKKGPIGLHMAWLAAAATTKDAYDRLKVDLSGEAGHEKRVHGRRAFLHMTEKKQGLYKDIVEHEARLRGDREEPLTVVV